MTQQTRALTRNEFYKLAHECRDYALRLATFDQDTVQRQVCAEYNLFLQRVRTYDKLREPLAVLKPARPITRAMVLVVVLAVWLFFSLCGVRLWGSIALLGLGLSTTMIFLVFLIPAGAFGTTVAEVEGRVLVVVETLQHILANNEMGFTEAAFFAVRDVLQQAADELRQQVYLARAEMR